MKKIALMTAFIMVIPMAMGCTSLHEKWETNSFTPEMDAKTITEVKTIGKIRGSASRTVLFGFIPIGGDSNYADGVSFSPAGALAVPGFGPGLACKMAAAYKALEDSGANYILNPRYTLTTTDYLIYQKIMAEVEGEGCVVEKRHQAPDCFHYECCQKSNKIDEVRKEKKEMSRQTGAHERDKTDRNILGTATIKVQQAHVRKGRKILATVEKGETLDVIQIKGNWYGVLPYEGWLHKNDIIFKKGSH